MQQVACPNCGSTRVLMCKTINTNVKFDKPHVAHKMPALTIFYLFGACMLIGAFWAKQWGTWDRLLGAAFGVGSIVIAFLSHAKQRKQEHADYKDWRENMLDMWRCEQCEHEFKPDMTKLGDTNNREV